MRTVFVPSLLSAAFVLSLPALLSGPARADDPPVPWKYDEPEDYYDDLADYYEDLEDEMDDEDERPWRFGLSLEFGDPYYRVPPEVDYPAYGYGVAPEDAVVTDVPADIQPYIDAIINAREPGEVIRAYADGLTIDPYSVPLEQTYVRRMVELGAPHLAEAQAHDLVERDPQDGLAWAVLAYLAGTRAETGQALEYMINAVQFLPEDVFVQRTAGQLLAWYDLLGGREELPAELRDAVEQVRAALERDEAFASAYLAALDFYEQPATAEAAPVEGAPPYLEPGVEEGYAVREYEVDEYGYTPYDYGYAEYGYTEIPYDYGYVPYTYDYEPYAFAYGGPRFSAFFGFYQPAYRRIAIIPRPRHHVVIHRHARVNAFVGTLHGHGFRFRPAHRTHRYISRDRDRVVVTRHASPWVARSGETRIARQIGRPGSGAPFRDRYIGRTLRRGSPAQAGYSTRYYRPPATEGRAAQRRFFRPQGAEPRGYRSPRTETGRMATPRTDPTDRAAPRADLGGRSFQRREGTGRTLAPRARTRPEMTPRTERAPTRTFERAPAPPRPAVRPPGPGEQRESVAPRTPVPRGPVQREQRRAIERRPRAPAPPADRPAPRSLPRATPSERRSAAPPLDALQAYGSRARAPDYTRSGASRSLVRPSAPAAREPSATERRTSRPPAAPRISRNRTPPSSRQPAASGGRTRTIERERSARQR